LFKGTNADITEENIQSRLRGTLLMAVSNKFGNMVVTTGNKSEVSVGYATLYGDMNGGYNPIKDIYKTEVFALSRWRNENKPVRRAWAGSAMKAPVSRKLLSTSRQAPNCAPTKRTKTACRLMMRWTIFCFALVEDERGVDEIIARGHDAETVKRIEHFCMFPNINAVRPRRARKSAIAISAVTAVTLSPMVSATRAPKGLKRIKVRDIL
jgi:NAD+ synthase